MIYKIGEYEIKLTLENSYHRGSHDNVTLFDHQYIFGEGQPTVQIGIAIYKNDVRLRGALIAGTEGTTCIHEKSQVVHEDGIAICCSNLVFKLSLPSLKLLWVTQADRITCFEIFEINDDYIIHGEMSISRLAGNGQLIWQKIGKDIFATIDGVSDDFKIENNIILATDFEGNRYRFNLDGEEIFVK
ncbi:hypothetical protein GGR28_003755 [Lewinella aquimaris]|uniref:Uncharacterized protein n=1 Tax=Neolewinella aquimaris TaxID=1835722 RepID=A0A840EGU4_9BACT|nr:hypothetical protein [Neolewinella aquimaris]MBB4081108.1 hypothetical protein [Neolewinella aquimaris]